MIRIVNPLVLAGLVFLLIGVGGTLVPLATIRFGELEVAGISAFSALNTFIGLVLIFFGMRRGRGIR